MTWSASTRMPPRSTALRARRDADLRARARRAGRRPTSRPGACPSPPISPPAWRRRDAVFIAVGTPSRRGDGHADLSYVYAAAEEIADALDGPTVIVTKSTVPVGTGDEVERIVARGRARPRASASPPIPNSCARAPRSRISSGPTASSSAPTTSDAREVMRADLPAAVAQPVRADPVHRPAHRRADQICRQRLPRDQDHLHQRDRRSVRGGRRRRAGGVARHRPGQPHRPQVPPCRPRLWRLLLPQGHAGAAQDRRGLSRRRCASSRRWSPVNDSAQARDGAQGDQGDGRRCARQDDRACSASPSSPIPTTCAMRPPSR